MTPRRRVTLGATVAVYLVGVLGLVGMAVERIRDDWQRREVVRRQDEAQRAARALAIELERQAERNGRATPLDGHGHPRERR